MPTFTVLSLKTYKPHATQRREIRDHGAVGLHLVIQPRPTGSRGWAFRFRDASGKSAKLTLGKLDETPGEKASRDDDKLPPIGTALTLGDARAWAGILNRELARGVDLVAKYAARSQKKAATANEANSFRAITIEFFRTYRTKRSKERPRRWRDDARLLGLKWKRTDDPDKVEPEVLKASLSDLWGRRPIAEITRREIEDVVADARAKGIPGLKPKNPAVSENRARKLHAGLSILFTWAARKRYIDVDPTTAIEAPHAPKARSRILASAELRWVWQAAGELPFPHGPVVRLLLLCGQRLNETGGMRWSELNEDASEWRIPPQRTKNHRPHLLGLPQLAREIIKGQARIEGRDLVFSVGGKSPPSNWAAAKHDMDSRMSAIAKAEREKVVAVPHWTLHDLRRSFASGLQDIGVHPQIIERALNHVSGPLSAGIVGVYQVLPREDDVRAALSAWSRFLMLVANVELHRAHEAFLLKGDDDERSRNKQHFRECVAAGGERWQFYIDTLSCKSPPKVSDLKTERRRRSRR